MGQLIESLSGNHGVKVVSTVDPKGGAQFKDITEESMKGVDVAIDFSHPTGALENAKKYAEVGVNVVMGTTLGMMLANVPAVWIGEALSRRVNMRAMRWIAAALFVVLGVLTLMAGDGAMGLP